MQSLAVTRVLHVVPSFFPATAFGGPIVSTYRLCNHLAAQNLVVLRVITTDSSGPRRSDRLDASARPPSLYPGYRVHFCRKLVGTAIAPSSLLWMWPHICWADIIHIHGMYSFTTLPALLASRILRKPVVLSPHGAFLSWSGTRSRRRKLIWNRVCRSLLQPGRSVVHATSDAEATASRRALVRIRAEIIPYGVDVPSAVDRDWLPGGHMRILFMGRLDPIKGLENVLHGLARLTNLNWTFRICGVGENDYTNSLKRLADDLGISERILFSGFVDGADKDAAYRTADVCVVPSFIENFSMVVAEALAHGTPVIASTGTPWKELEVRGAGRWVPNDPESLAAAILSMRQQDLGMMGASGRQWMASDLFGWPMMTQRMVTLYDDLIMKQHRRARNGIGSLIS